MSTDVARPHRFVITDVGLARTLLPGACVLALMAGYAAAYLAVHRSPSAALMLPALATPFLLWRRPQAGMLIMFGAAVVVEQFTYTVGSRNGADTDRIPFFHSLSAGSGVTLAEGLLFLTVLVWVLKSVQYRHALIPRSPLSLTIRVMMGVTAVFFGVGLARRGTFKIAMWEIRPFFYVGISYLVAASLLAYRQALRTLMWIMVIGSGFKGLYGIYIWHWARHMQPKPEALLGHEESFFFGIFVFLTIALWLWGIEGRLRTTATVLLPVVAFADMVNSRRTAYAVLGVGIIVLFVVACRCLPERRRILKVVLPGILVISIFYFPAFWHKSGTLASPASAVKSTVQPDARDLSSDTYRVQENKNLALNIKRSNDLGTGFGRPIDYAIPIVDITQFDPMIKYVPHDTVLWVWMREGMLGEVAFLMVIGAGFLKACDVAKRTGLDREGGAFAAVVLCGLAGYVVMGYEDMGFDWFRLAFAVGIMLGALEARGTLAPPRARSRHDYQVRIMTPDQDRRSVLQLVGSGS